MITINWLHCKKNISPSFTLLSHYHNLVLVMMSFCIMFVVRIIASRPYYIQFIQIITIGDHIISILFYLQPH